MKSIALDVHRLPVRLVRDDRQVIATSFSFGFLDKSRVQSLLQRVSQLSEEEVERQLHRVIASFKSRHSDIRKTLEENFATVRSGFALPNLSSARQLLIGAYFTSEYSFASAALFNPSIVPHPNQDRLTPGQQRFLMSLRAVGEGHVSSIVFRTGVVDADGSIRIDATGPHSDAARLANDQKYSKGLFWRKLKDLAINGEITQWIMDKLGEWFTYPELQNAIHAAHEAGLEKADLGEVSEGMTWLAKSNYQIELAAGTDIDDIVIFPRSSNESRGIEDVRLVRFIEDDGSAWYYGTYTAYNGIRILPQLLETRDFRWIGIHTLNGKSARNKGMALFPRRIDGQYVMCSRIDGENLYIMMSDNVYFWNNADLLKFERQPWEFVQVGNCGSPIETPEGWLLITHGVGPMREYCLGAMLLDLHDPRKVIGRLRQPLLVPNEDERNGYVPNVVYSCGSMVHGERLIIPYGISDCASTFASVSLRQLIESMM